MLRLFPQFWCLSAALWLPLLSTGIVAENSSSSTCAALLLVTSCDHDLSAADKNRFAAGTLVRHLCTPECAASSLSSLHVARSLREEGEGEEGEEGEDEEEEEEGKECECKECECKESEKGEECECKECECSEEGEECEEEEGEGGGTRKANVMAATVIGLILLTIFFETLREGMEERAGEDLAEIVDAMVGELTVLGFIGLVTFISIQTKAANWLGMYAFPADEEHGHEFVEVLEELHMLLFFVMVCRALLPPDKPQHCSMPPLATPADAPQRP